MSKVSHRIGAVTLVALLASGCAEPAPGEPAEDRVYDGIAIATPKTAAKADYRKPTSCPISGHAELEIASCVTIEAPSGRMVIAEERYADLTMATVYAELDEGFVSVASTEAYGPDEAIVAAEITVYQDHVPAVVIAFDHELGARSFDVIAWDATELPEVVASFGPAEGQHAVVLQEGLRVVEVQDTGHVASTLKRKAPGQWQVVTHGFIDSGAGTPSLAADRLLLAWNDDDEEAAREVASEDAITKLFSFEPGASWIAVACEVEGDLHRCGYSYEGGFAQLEVAEPTVGSFEVVGLSFSAD